MISMFRRLFILALLALAGCGGNATATQCVLPSEVLIGRGVSGGMVQYEKATPSSQYVPVPVADPSSAIFECPGTGVQWVTFKTRAESFFQPANGNPALGDHLAVLTRGTIDLSVPRYIARGMILHRTWGIASERFHLDNAVGGVNLIQCYYWHTCYPSGVMPSHNIAASDNVFEWSVRSTPTDTSYSMKSVATGQTATGSWSENHDLSVLTGSDVAFAVLCKTNCPGPFIVRFYDIQAGWE